MKKQHKEKRIGGKVFPPKPSPDPPPVESCVYNPDYGDDRVCECGHPYYRHFDTYEHMKAVGCKYCACFDFKEHNSSVTKQHNAPVDHARDPKANYPGSKATRGNDLEGLGRVKEEADDILTYMRDVIDGIADLDARANAEMEAVTARYGAWLNPLRDELAALEKEITALMKKNKGVLFDPTDVVNLAHGSLIRNLADKVSIPKTALEACKHNGFVSVIKVVESLDRDAIEKWPDAKLTLIGAERKPKEEFKYSIKKSE